MKTGKIILNFIPSISWTVRKTMKSLAMSVEQKTLIRHNLNVYVVPAPKLNDGKGGSGVGLFTVFPKGSKPKYGPLGPRIYIAGKLPPDEDISMNDYLTEVFTHEIVHYEQFRDKRKAQERGVEVRARSLRRMMGLTY